MHGVLRDAVRPFAYRNSARRLLHAGGSSRIRPVYGNGFIPVDFKHLAMIYGYAHGATDHAAPPLPPARPALNLGPIKNPPADALAAPAAPSMPDKPALLQRSNPVTHEASPGDNLSAALKTVRSAAAEVTVDIRIPGGAPQKPSAMRPPYKMEQGAMPAAAPSRPLQQTVLNSAAKPAAALPQRMPTNFSLNALARMLEQHNFEKSGDCTPTDAISSPGQSPNPSPNSNQAAEKTRTRLPRITPHITPHITPRNTIARSVPEKKQPGLPHIAGIKKHPAVVTSAAARPSAQAAAAATLRLPRLQPAPSRLAHDSARHDSVGHGLPESQSQTRTHRPARAPIHRAAQRPVKPERRITVIRRSAPAAFWERSYLSHTQLRMYR